MVMATATATAMPNTTGGPAAVGGTRAVKMIAVTMPHRFAVLVTERSMPPVSMVSMMAMARMPISGICTDIELKFDRVGKISGLARLMTRKMATMMTNSRVRLPSRAARLKMESLGGVPAGRLCPVVPALLILIGQALPTLPG